MKCQRLITTLTLAAGLTAACGHGSSDDGDGSTVSSSDFAGNRADVTGTITSQTGSQSQMAGWAVALIERDSMIGRVAEADASGTLKFGKVSFDAAQTAILLSPDYLLQAVLSLPSSKTNTIKQFFTLNKNILPRLIQKGPIITMQSTDTISITSDMAADSDGNGTPDGVASLGLQDSSAGFPLTSTVDTDSDGIPNTSDADIDGDGLINVIDTDEDGDGILDVVDADANGDGIPDTQQQASSQHFKAGVEFIAVQNESTPSGSTTVSTLKFAMKVRDGVTISDVKIRGATSLLKDSTYISSDGATGTWDNKLLDDGNSEDSSANDLLYARKITLASGKAPRANQMVFFQLTIGTGADQWTAEYPYIFPSLTPAAITGAYDSATRTVTLGGNPFGESMQDFVWTVSVANSDSVKIYESATTAGATRTFTLPANILETGKTYTYTLTAQLLDKVPGYPAMIVHAAKGTISN